MRDTCHQRRQTNLRELRLSCQKKGQFETLNVLEVSKRTCRLEKLLFQTAKGKSSLVVTKKNNEPNQILTEVVVVE